MKRLTSFIVVLLISSSAFALGDSTPLQNPQSGMTDSVSTLNQVEREEEEDLPESRMEPQDAQEKLYEDDIEREQQEWEESRTIDEYRYDVPE